MKGKDNNYMDYIELLHDAIKKDEIYSFLRGENRYKIEISQYVPGVLPTNVEKALSIIYECYQEEPNVKDLFIGALGKMINGTAFDVYLSIIYFMDILFDEHHNLSTFNIDIDKMVMNIQRSIENNRSKLKRQFEFPDGTIKKDAWNDIVRWNKVCRIKYDIIFLK